MAKAKLDEGGTAVAELEAFYHLGLLPATGPVTLFKPALQTGVLEEVKYNPYDLWNGAYEQGMPIFAAKARQFNGLRVRDWHFHATGQAVVHRGPTQTDHTDYPGGVAWMSASRAESIAKSCHEVFIRWVNGISTMGNPSAKTIVWDMAHGKRPADMPDEEWKEFLKHKREQCPPFNPRTDKFVSEFVYIRKLDFDRSRLDETEYAQNPNRFHVQMVGGFTRDWFESPPRSVAEVYPQA
jgi:hypothetical protein